MARSLVRRRAAAELLLRAVGLAVVAFVAVAQLPSSFLRGLRQPSHLLRPSAPTRQLSVQRQFFQFPDWEAEERERQRILKEKQEAEAAAKRRDTLTKGGIAVLGLVAVGSVLLGQKEDTPAVKSATSAGKQLATATSSPAPPEAPQAAPIIVDPKASKRLQEAQKALKKSEDARTKADAERKKRQAAKKKEDEEAAKKKADAAKQKDSAKKAKEADIKKKKDDLEKSKKEADERIKKAKEEAAKTNPGGPQWGTILPLAAIAGAGVYFVGPKLKKETPKKEPAAAAEAKPATEAAEKPAAAAAAEKPAAAAAEKPAAAAAEKPAAAAEEKPAAAAEEKPAAAAAEKPAAEKPAAAEEK